MSIEVSPRVQTLLNRLTSTRAGYLDELDFDLDARLGSPAHVSVVGDIADLITRVKGLNDIHDDLGTVDGNVSAILTDIVDMEGTGFVKDTHSLVNIEGYVDCLPAALGDLVEKNLTAILSDSTAFAGADIGTIKGYVDCLPAALGNLVEKDLTAILLDSVAFNGADVKMLYTTAIGASPVANSIAERIKALDDNFTATRGAYLDNLISSEVSGTYSHPDGVTEQDAVEITPTEIGRYWKVALDLTTLTKTTTIRVYVKIDGTNYVQTDEAVYPTDFPTAVKGVKAEIMPSSKAMKVTLQSAEAEGAARAVPYFYIMKSEE